jgi:colanic acid/amylovoran biosynthesis glycosyltransferase
MYNEITHNLEYNHAILCQYTENMDIFPFRGVYPVFKSYNLAAKVSMIIARARASYNPRPYLRVVKSLKPDLYHAHFSHEAWRNRELILQTGLPLVTTFYGLDVDKLPLRRSWKRRYPAIFAEGRVFIVEGPHMAKRLEARGCPAGKIRVVYQAADIERIRKIPRQRDDSRIRVLFVGLGRLKKGAEHAVKAFANAAKKNKRLQLHLVGEGAYRRKTEHILKEQDMLHRAVYHGFVDVNTYLSLLVSSDILLAPSITDPNGDTEGGAPVCVIEALAAGVCVVGTNHCDIPNVVPHEKYGLLCDEGDIDALSENLKQLAGDEKLRKTLSKNAYELSPERHDICRRVEGINRVYRSVLR